MRLYGVDANFIRAMAGSKISLVIGASNGDIPSLATDPSAASSWISANVLAFPDSQISTISVGIFFFGNLVFLPFGNYLKYI